MPGLICCLPLCGSCSRGTLAVFKITNRKSSFYLAWRKQTLDIVKRYRVIDSEFQKQLDAGKAAICEKHYKKEDIEYTATGRKTIKLCALPTENLPKTSHSKHKPPERRVVVRHLDDVDCPSVSTVSPGYKNFSDIKTAIGKMKSSNISIKEIDIETLSLKIFEKPYLVPKFELIVDSSLCFTCIIFGFKLPDDHIIYKEHRRSLTNITIKKLFGSLEELSICHGVDTGFDNGIIHHVIPRETNPEQLDVSPVQVKHYRRIPDCHVLISSDDQQCMGCATFTKKENSKAQKNERQSKIPAKKKAPVTKTNPLRLKQTLKLQRSELLLSQLKCVQLQKKVEQMQEQIYTAGVHLPSEIVDDIHDIMTANEKDASPFMQMMWEEQKQALQKQKVSRYHPMIIRFCLSLASKSASAYDELRDSKILTLPSRRTLRDYRNAIKPRVGFNPEVTAELCKLTSVLKGVQRFVVLSFDEMKIQSNLVYDKYTGELIGYKDLGDAEINYNSFEKLDELATHALVFYVRGIASDLKFNFAYFATKSLTSFQIMPLFWKAVSILEMTCKLPIIAAISDGASPNRRFFKLHSLMDNDPGRGITYRTINLYSPDRYICFFADAPHLMKTARNCLHHSGTNRHSRYMWNSEYLAWSHIQRLVNDEIDNGLKIIPKLSQQHTNLTSYSVMNVHLAVQVLSETTSKVLNTYYPDDTSATSEFCAMMDKFFDIMNVRNQTEGHRNRKEFLYPFRSLDDKRFKWLENVFLLYFSEWKQKIVCREGNFSSIDRDKMFISQQTYEGLQISTYSVIEATKFLINQGLKYVLTEKFNQDVAEEYIGRQRCVGRRNDNPTVYQFGYNDNVIRTQRSVVTVTGNTKGASSNTKRQPSWFIVDNSSLPKRKSK